MSRRRESDSADTSIHRREFLRRSGLGIASLAAGATPFVSGLSEALGQDAIAGRRIAGGVPRLEPIEIGLTCVQRQRQILPGMPTNVWLYEGDVPRGPRATLSTIPGSYLGPIFRVDQGARLRIMLKNDLPEMHTTHWHGLDVPELADGHPRFAVMPGEEYLYEFRVINRAGTYWFHPHPDMRTGFQVAQGMAGLFIVRDPHEQALALPRGEYDVPLILQDRIFDADNQIMYDDPMMQMPAGYVGDTVLVNGFPNYTLSAATRVYRFRLVNGANARVYKLQWSDGTPMVVIGNDGGLIDVPRAYPYVMLSPGERIELWADFRDKTLGAQITLRSLSFSGAGPGGNSTLPQASAFDVMNVSIDRAEAETLTLPTTLSAIEEYRLQDAVNIASPKAIASSAIGSPSQFVLNGGPFEMETVATNEIVEKDTLEVWSFVNNTSVIHPIHFHGRQFQILDRSVTPGRLAAWNTVSAGYCDAGWKDTFTMMPGETVRILIRFSKYPGLFLYHCHNLEHEDMGMMRNIQIC
ncbi:MAG: multicopper oxidase family protein [Phycisphaerae bacterium]